MQHLKFYWSQFITWLFQKRHKALARLLGWRTQKAFTTHPQETGETYIEHLWFTFKMSVRFVFVSIILMTHGIFPFLFTRAASSQIERVYVIMKNRIPKARRDEIDALDFDI